MKEIFCIFTGPFNGSAIIYAFSIEAGNGRLWESENISFDKIQEKYKG